jgi:hypothetical protein
MPPSAGECLADVASERLTELLSGGKVRLETDTTDRDRYGRLLRYVYVGDTFVNEVLVRDGLAIARRYPPDVARADALASAQAQADAEAAGRGIWNHRALADAAGLELSALPADPPGVDNDDLNGEWVELTNTGHSTIDLTGWGLKDESASHRYGFPDRFELPAGGRRARGQRMWHRPGGPPALVHVQLGGVEQLRRHSLPPRPKRQHLRHVSLRRHREPPLRVR